MERIQIYTDWSAKAQKEAPPAFVLHPLHERQFPDLDIEDKSEFMDVDRFSGIDGNFDELFYGAGLDEAEFGVLPCDWKHYRWASTVDRGVEFLKLMQELRKRSVVQYNSDDEASLGFDRIMGVGEAEAPVVVRTSIRASKRKLNEYVMPGFVGDPLNVYGEGKVTLRIKDVKPVVSFCGRAARAPLDDREFGSFRQLVEEGMESVDKSERERLVYGFRARVLASLESKKLKTEFVVRDGYCGGVDRKLDVGELVRVREEYFGSILDSDYVVCVRGIGNYSYRMYETLAMGRIPILVNTDTPLPWDEEINWRDHCVWVEYDQVDAIDEIVSEDYHNKSDDQFEQAQRKNRQMWEEMLTLDKFYYRLFMKLKGEER